MTCQFSQDLQCNCSIEKAEKDTAVSIHGAQQIEGLRVLPLRPFNALRYA